VPQQSPLQSGDGQVQTPEEQTASGSGQGPEHRPPQPSAAPQALPAHWGAQPPQAPLTQVKPWPQHTPPHSANWHAHWKSAPQTWLSPHAPQSWVPPQPSGAAVPHSAPTAVQVFFVQHAPWWQACPSVQQVVPHSAWRQWHCRSGSHHSSAPHAPQYRFAPQPSVATPHSAPSAVQVVGEQHAPW